MDPVTHATGDSVATLRRDGDALVFTGAIVREAVPALWLQALPQLGGLGRVDLTAVSSVDSAGLALLAELSARAGGVSILGHPAGLGDLRTAYRLDDALAFDH